MDEQGKPAIDGEKIAQQNYPDALPPAPPQVAKPVSSSSEKPATAQQSAFERATLRWAKAAVIMSGLAAFFVCLQWWEMHSGSVDTHNLAVAAGSQATWTKNLAGNMQTQADRTKDLADRMKEQADRTKDLADRTKTIADQAVIQAGAARSAAEEAELSERPWIKIVDVKARGNGDIIPALSFQGFGYGLFPNTPYHAVTLQVGVSLKNVGHSVAEIYVQPWLYLPMWGQGNGFADKVLAEQEKFCGKVSMPKQVGAGQILFPDEDYEWNAGLSSSVNVSTIDYLRNPNAPGSWPPIIKNNPNGYVIPNVILCVNYRLSGSTQKTYQTQAWYSVIRTYDRTQFFDVGQDVKAPDLEITRNPPGDHAQ